MSVAPQGDEPRAAHGRNTRHLVEQGFRARILQPAEVDREFEAGPVPGERDAVRDFVELRDEAEQARQQIGADVAADMQPDEVWTSSFGRMWSADLCMRHAEQPSGNLAGTAGARSRPADDAPDQPIRLMLIRAWESRIRARARSRRRRPAATSRIARMVMPAI